MQIVPDFTGFRRSVYWLDFRSEPCVIKVCKDLGDHSDFFKNRSQLEAPTNEWTRGASWKELQAVMLGRAREQKRMWRGLASPKPEEF